MNLASILGMDSGMPNRRYDIPDYAQMREKRLANYTARQQRISNIGKARKIISDRKNFFSLRRRGPGLIGAATYGIGSFIASAILGNKQDQYEAYSGDTSGREVTNLVQSSLKVGGVLAGGASLFGFGPIGMMGKAADTAGAVGRGFMNLSPAGKALALAPIGAAAGIYNYPKTSLGIIGGMYAVGSAGLAVSYRKELMRGIGKIAPGTTAFLGAGALGAYVGGEIQEPFVGEGNYEALYSNSASPVQKMNFSTAGLVQALHRGQRTF